MRPELQRIGERRSPLVIVDEVSGDPAAIIETAAALAPFSAANGSFYPGLRRIVDEGDVGAWDYAQRTMAAIAPYIGGAFDADQFDLVEASFSMVTTAPAALVPAQRAPHFDSTDPDYLAVLHYLSATPASGTAFYRQRATGIETLDDANLATFVASARRESARLAGYIRASNESFEQIGAVEAVADRLIIYRGCLLHSGIIPPDMILDPDPRRGRLTANFFVQVRR